MKRFLDYNKNLKQRAQELRLNMTEPEKKLWHEFLATFPYPCYRQRIIDNFIVDFYCPKLKLVIEVDGPAHFTEDGLEYDQKRSAVLEGCGLSALRFSNHDVIHTFNEVVQKIKNFTDTVSDVNISDPFAQFPMFPSGQFPLTPFSKGGKT